MKLYVPNYYSKFKCIASACKNTCCAAGWEIDIDEKSLEFYKNVHGELSKELNENIILSPTPHFKLDSNGICPFLTENKLCNLYLNFGENSLCEICKEHPRFYEFFRDFIEGGIGLCCEEACRIILTEAEPFSTYEVDTTFTESDSYDTEIFDYLYKNRTKIINYLNRNDISLNSKLKDILWFTSTLQQNIDFNLLDEENIFDVKTYSTTSVLPILEFLTTLTPNNPDWLSYLKDSINIFNSNLDKQVEFEKNNPTISQYLNNIAIYFIWRYFLKGVFDEEILSKVKLMVISVVTLKTLFFCKWIEQGTITLDDCVNITRKYSEEIEYCLDNVYKLAEASYELDYFSTEYLLSL